MAVKVYTIWSHPLYRDFVMAILTHPDIEWVGDSASMDVATEEITKLLPDIILVEDEKRLTAIMQHTPEILDSVILLHMNMEKDHLVVYNQEKRLIRDIIEIQDLVLALSG